MFLLNSVEQLIHGKSRQEQFNGEVDYVKFKFLDREMQPVYIVFDKIDIRQSFVEQIEKIIPEIQPKNCKLFFSEQNTPPKPVSQSLRQTDKIADYLESEKTSLIRKLSYAIRTNRIGFAINYGFEISDRHPTAVEWTKVPKNK